MTDELREITPEELQTILAQHKLWRGTDGKEGARADLAGANLARATELVAARSQRVSRHQRIDTLDYAR